MSKTILALAFLALALALAPTAFAGDLRVEAHHGATQAEVSTQAPDAPAVAVPAPAPAPAAPDAPHAPGAPISAPKPGDVIELSSIHTGASHGPGGVDVSAGGSSSQNPDEGSSMGETLTRSVIPAVEQAAPPAVAAVGIAALLQGLGLWRVATVGAIGLYSRLTKSELFDNEHRDKVYKLIQQTPGMSVSELSEKTGLGWGTTVYHLDRLERAGFVAPERGGLHKCYFPVGTIARESRKGLGALKSDQTKSIALYLTANPGTSQTDLCQALGLSASAASKQISKLEGAGLVRRERDWKTVHLHPTESLLPLLGPAAPAPAPATAMAAPALVA